MKKSPVISISPIAVQNRPLSGKDRWEPVPSIKATSAHMAYLAAGCGDALEQLGPTAQYVEVIKVRFVFVSRGTKHFSPLDQLFFEARAIISIHDEGKEQCPAVVLPVINGIIQGEGSDFAKRLHATIAEQMQRIVKSMELDVEFWRQEFQL